MDLMRKYLSDSYGIVTSLTYDTKTRTMIMECADKAGAKKPSRRITLTNIREYAEDAGRVPEVGELLIGFDVFDDEYCICTESREITIKTELLQGLFSY